MNRFLSLSLAALLTAGLATSCKDDLLSGGDLNAGQTEDNGRTLWIGAAIALPSEGRTRADKPGSTTDDNVTNDGKDLTNSNIDKGENGQNDYEFGYDYENNIRTILLVFANGKNKYVTHSVVSGISKTPSDLVSSGSNMGALQSKYADLYVTGEIKHDALVKAYGEGGVLSGDDKIVYVYAFCNFTSRMLERFNSLANVENYTDPDGEWYNWGGLVEEEPSPAGYTPLTQNSIWSKNSFLMSNATKCEVSFPDDITEWDKYADKNSPFLVANKQNNDQGDFKWTPINVERVAARLDFKDGSKGKYDWEERPNTYPLWVDITGDGSVDPAKDYNIISIQLNRMCLVNMAKNYYYLRRVSDDGSNETDADNTNEWFIGGTEMSDNYVVDYDWSAKRTVGGIKASNEKDYFNFPLYTDDVKNADAGGETTGYAYNRFGWYTDRIQEDFLDKDPSNDTWTNPSTGSGYKIWRYVTENTIPATAKGADGSDGTTDQQKTVQSTGIVFKGRIVAGRDIEEDTDHKYMSEKVKDAITAINVDGFGKGIAKYEDLEDEDREKIPYLYSYNNILYAGHEELIERANADGNNGPLHHVANEILAHWVLVEKPDDFTVTHTPKNGTVTKVYIYKEKPASGDESMTVEAWAKINKKDSDGKAEPEYFLVKDEDGKEVQEYRDYEIDMDHFLSLAPLSDVVVYRPYNEDEKDINGQSMGDGWGYYCYYFYWNRHNDNGKGGLMGPMEFATVRNNVYKLAVTNINKLGHPRNTDHDPDPLTPETPDEDPTNYIQVQVNVLPWVVRVNNIEF